MNRMHGFIYRMVLASHTVNFHLGFFIKRKLTRGKPSMEGLRRRDTLVL